MFNKLYIARAIQIPVLLGITICLFASCSSKFSFQKRKYTKGFYFSSSGKHYSAAEKVADVNKLSHLQEKGAEAEKREKNITLKGAGVIIAQADDLTMPAKPVSKMAPFKPKHIFKSIEKQGSTVVKQFKKQQTASLHKTGPVSLIFKILLVCVIIVALALVIIIIVLTG